MSQVPIDHPWASVQLAIEQLLLLENHAQFRWCPQCAQKHARTAAALADEAVSLSGGAEQCELFAAAVREVADLADAMADKNIIGAEARKVRRVYINAECDFV